MLMASASPSAANAWDAEVCPQLIVRSAEKVSLDLSDDEKRLLCGGKPDSAWSDIPDSQARFEFKTFLQDRAYYHPRFSEENGRAIVELGAASLVTAVHLEGDPPDLLFERKRGVIGADLTPKFLDEIEKWISHRLETLGYGCPRIKAEGDPETGMVRVKIESGLVQSVLVPSEDVVEGVTPGMFRRADAFPPGSLFDADLLTISERRLLAKGQVESTHFTWKCTPAGVALHQGFVPGPPHLLTLGAGINTEGLLVAKVGWQNTRLGRSASTFEISVLASRAEQLVNADVNWYVLHYPSRMGLLPAFQLTHQNWDPFEALTEEGSFSFFTNFDSRQIGMNFQFGPAYDLTQTLRGLGPQTSNWAFLRANATGQTHDFEYWAGNPRTGGTWTAAISGSSQDALSSASLQKLQLSGQGLWNLKNLDPPVLVFGIRGAYSASFTPERPGPATDIPPTLLEWLGGSRNIRGFGQYELPRDGNGALNSLFVSTEARLGGVLPLGIAPFFFFDAAALGNTPGELQAPIYTSPGTGLRWGSPIGVFRISVAHGFPAEVGHWQFYFSYGEEF